MAIAKLWIPDGIGAEVKGEGEGEGIGGRGSDKTNTRN